MNHGSSPESYSVVLLGFDPSNPMRDGLSDTERLQQTFKISAAQALKFIHNTPVVVKRNANEKQARSYQKKLENIGALVKIQPPLPAFFGAESAPAQPAVSFGSAPAPNPPPIGFGAPEQPNPFGVGSALPTFGADDQVSNFLQPPAPSPSPASPLGAPDPFGLGAPSEQPSEFIPPHRRSQVLPQLGPSFGSSSPAIASPNPAPADDSSWVHDQSPALQTAAAQASSANWFQPTRSYANSSLEDYLGAGQDSPSEPNPFAHDQDEPPVDCPRCGRSQPLSQGDCQACGFNLANYYNPRNSMTIEFDVEKLRAGASLQANNNILSGALSSINVPSKQDPAVKQTFSNLLVYNELASGKDASEVLQNAMDAQSKPPSQASLNLKAIAADIPTSTGFGQSGEHEALSRPSLSDNAGDDFDPFSTSLGTSGGFKSVPRMGSRPSPSNPAQPQEPQSNAPNPASAPAALSERPPLQPAVHTRPRPTSAVSATTPDFWAGIGSAFTVPLKGSGFAWLLTIAGLLLLSSASSFVLACFALPVMVAALVLFCGFTGAYFGKTAQAGLDGDDDGPDGHALGLLIQEPSAVAIPGLALTALAALLFILPSGLAAKFADPQPAAPPATVQPLSEDDLYYDANGKLFELDESATSPVKAWTIDGTPVTINVQAKTVSTQTDEPKEKKLDLKSIFMALGVALFPYFYWPMALTVGSLSGSMLNMFNPVLVLRGIFKAPAKYLFVVFVGFAIPAGIFAGLAVSLGITQSALLFAVAACLGLLAVGYTAGVQGYLMGLLVGSQREDFADFA